jgi:hypothetical protein
MSHKQTNQQLNQAGFSAVEAVLIVIIVGLVAGIGYYVYHAKQTTNTVTAPSNTSVKRFPSYLTLSTTNVPTGWTVSNNAAFIKSLVSTDKTSTVTVTQITQSSLKASDAESFVAQQVKALGKAGTGGMTNMVGTSVQLQIETNTGAQSVTAYPAMVMGSDGKVSEYTKTAYVVATGYYVKIIESSTTSDLTQADQALQAVTIKQ